MYHGNLLSTRETTFSPTPAAGRSVEAVVGTDKPIEVWSWQRGEAILEALPLGAASLPSQAPLLLDHDRAVPAMVGSAVDFQPRGGELVARLRFAAGVPAADDVWSLVEGRHLRSVSIGYTVYSYREIRRGQTATVAGRTYTAPPNRSVFVAETWSLREVSLVPIPADSAAQIRSQRSFLNERVSTMEVSVLDVLGNGVRDMRWPQLLAADLKRQGVDVPAGDGNVIRTAMSTVGGLNSVVGLINSTILGGFRAAPDTTAGWVRVVSLPNFLAAKIAAVTTAPRLEKLVRGMPAVSVSFGAAVEGWQLARFAASFVLDEQDLIDGQEIGVYTLAIDEVGRAARRLVPDLVYATVLGNGVMADGTPIFDSSRANLGTAALADTSLDAGLAAVGGQVAEDEAGGPVHQGLSAGYLIVPPALFGLGKRLAHAMATGEGDLVVRAESRLGDAGVVDPRDDTIIEGSLTDWMLACPSEQAPGVVVGSLGGRVEPTIRNYELREGEWGLGFDIFLDLACTVVDGKPLYFSTGSGA